MLFRIFRSHILVKDDKSSDRQSPGYNKSHIGDLINFMSLERGLRDISTSDCISLRSVFEPYEGRGFIPIRPKVFMTASDASNVSPPTLS